MDHFIFYVQAVQMHHDCRMNFFNRILRKILFFWDTWQFSVSHLRVLTDPASIEVESTEVLLSILLFRPDQKLLVSV